MPRRYARSKKERGVNEASWEEEQVAPARYSRNGDPETSRLDVYNSCQYNSIFYGDADPAGFFFRSNGNAIWAQKRWSAIKLGTYSYSIRPTDVAGPRGATGATGATGPRGATGATGATGICECNCPSSGELILNGGMESFTGGIPTDWTTSTPTKVSQVTAQGRVHSGESSVNLTDGATLFQVVPVNEGCFYEFSFFAHGEGAQVGVIATVTFVVPPSTQTLGLQISVRQQDMPNSNRDFGYYRGHTIQAPAGAMTAIINFAVTANGEQSMDLDDISFTIQ